MLPTLSVDGWITSINTKADHLMGYFFLNQYSQSMLYHSSIRSLPWLIATYASEPLALREQIGLSFYALFTPYFDDVNYQVEVRESQDSDAVYVIRLSASVVSDGVRYDLAYLIHTSKTTILTFTKLNNG